MEILLRAKAVKLTPSDMRVVELIGQGLTDKDIARALNRGLGGIKDHVRVVRNKLNMTRAEICGYAQLRRLVAHQPELIDQIKESMKRG